MTFLSNFRRKLPVPVTAQSDIKHIDVHFTSLMSSDVEFEGDLSIKGNTRIDGLFIGNIIKNPKATEPVTVHISSTGRFEGIIDVDNVIIDGEVSGKTTARMNLHVRGKISGEASYGNVVDITGVLQAHLFKTTLKEEKVINNEGEVLKAENVHPLQKRSAS